MNSGLERECWLARSALFVSAISQGLRLHSWTTRDVTWKTSAKRLNTVENCWTKSFTWAGVKLTGLPSLTPKILLPFQVDEESLVDVLKSMVGSRVSIQ